MKTDRFCERDQTSSASCRTAVIVTLAAYWLIAATTAQAHNFCATTSTELQDALTQASDGGMYNGQDNDIRLIHHVYKTGAATGNGPFVYSSSAVGSLSVSGGYNATCTNQPSDPTVSIIDGNSVTRVLEIHSAQGQINVFLLTIQNGETVGDVAGLDINPSSGDHSNVYVANAIITNNHATGVNGGVRAYVGVGYFLELDDSLIVGNSADQGNGAGELFSDGCGGIIAQDTITKNTTSLAGATGGLLVHDSNTSALCTIYVMNSIFWNNTTFGLYLEGSRIGLDYNDYGALGGDAPLHDVGPTSISPLFVDAANGDFHLSGDSPLLAYSPNSILFTDIVGNAFPVHGKVDLGAYAETVFVDGFDGG